VGDLTLRLNQVAGIGLSEADGAVVRANALTENTLGVLLTGGTESARVTGNVLSLNPGPGIRVENSAGNRIESNEIADSSGEGVVLEGAPGTVVASNTLTGNDAGGIAVLAASGAGTIQGNTITTTGSGGIEISESDGARVVGNDISQSGSTAITLELSANGLVQGNDVRGNPGGIELDGSSDNRIENNDAGGGSGSGISLDGGSLRNQVVGNRVSGNSGEGIYVADQTAAADGNLIEGNTASNNSGDGISVNAAVHTVRGNTANSNDGWGILAVSGTVDGGGNRASGNAEPQQCSGVVCLIGPAPGAPDTVLVQRPDDPSSSRNALFTFTGTDDTTPLTDLGFECRLDSTSDTDWVECDNPQEYTDLDPGDHVFEVRAVDLAGNVDPSPVRFEWTYVELPTGVAPVATIGLRPEPVTTLLEALFTFTADEPDVTFECSLDGEQYEPCAFAVEYEFDETQVGLHEFRVRATDFEGNVGPAASHEWTILGVVTTVTSGPAFEAGDAGEPPSGGETTETTATFEFEANIADSTFLCSLDLGPFEPCTSPLTYTGLPVGEHLLRIVATDPEGREELEAAEYEWTVVPNLDVVPPDTQITAGPPTDGPTSESAFTFTGTDDATAPAGLEFECRLDSTDEADFLPCTSPFTYPNPESPEPLAAGDHRFDVRAIDLEDNVDPSPATWEWTFTMDEAAPVTTIATGPAAQTAAIQATVTFTADDPFATFECALDGAAFEPCDSPHEIQGLEPGQHELAVRATDLSGNVGDAALHGWTVVGAPVTTIVTGPDPASSSPDAVFTFTADQAGSTFRCALDGAPLAPCTSPATYTGLAGGEHTFAVQARNTLGVLEAAPAEFTWTVTLPLPSPPETTLTVQPEASTSLTSASLEFTADQPDATFECSLDEAAFEPCTSPVTLDGLAVGEHDFAVRAVGADGETDPTPAAVEWDVVAAAPADTTPPETTLMAGPPATTTDTSATITLAASEPGSSYQCALDGAAAAPCTSPVTLTGLAVGPHELRAQAVDAAGNTDPTPLVVSWTVAAPPPSCPTTPATVTPVADSWVLRDSAGQNYGRDSILKVDSKSGADARALVRFNLPALPSGCVVTGAQLRLYASSHQTGRTLQALPVTAPWSETTVTWRNQPATGQPAATTSSGQGYRQWAVTEQVLAMYGGASNGFLIRDAAEGGGGRLQGFHSREESSNRPQLVITFGAAPVPPADTTPPQTTIVSFPAGSTTDTSASFSFTSSEAGSTFACSLDGAPPAPCASPSSVSGLAVGTHEFRVVATDPAGNGDSTPAVHGWTVVAPIAPAPAPQPVATCSATPVTVGADQDSWIQEIDPQKNNGTDSVLKVTTKAGENTRALVRFALPATPAGCEVTGVQLRVFNASPKSGHTLQAVALGGAWTEQGVTWANQPTASGTPMTAVTPSSGGWMTWNVTDMARAMLTGTNHGFLIRAATEGGNGDEQGFNSREKGSDNPPQLVITYGPAG
jgi:parallel beta-helix repeat protein